MLGSTMKTKYEADQPLAADPEFMAWIDALEKIMQAWGDKFDGGNSPYPLPLADGTGLECWHDMYSASFTPQEAFDEDQSNWQ